MRKQSTGAGKGQLIGLVSFLLVIVLGGVGFGFFMLGEYERQDAAARQQLADLRADSLALVVASQDSLAGQEDAFLRLSGASQSLNRNWQGLRDKLAAQNVDAEQLALVSQNSGTIYTAATALDANRDTILFLHLVAARLNETIPLLQQEYNNVVESLLEEGNDAQQVALAQMQSWRAERIARNVDKMLAGTADADEAADVFNYDASLFGEVLNAQLDGSIALGIAPIEEEFARESLVEILSLFSFVDESVDEIFAATPALLESRAAGADVLNTSPAFQTQLDELNTTINSLGGMRAINQQMVTIAAAAAVGLMMLIALLYNRRSADRTATVERENERNQSAILRLLDELADLAEGDLTTTATVTEDFTGTIADSINYTIDQLRELVTRINNTATRVTSAAQTTRSTALTLAEASDHQAQEIAGASAAVNEMAVTIDQVSANAAESAGVAERSVSIAANGAEVVQSTISGMDNIREQIQESSKRIKRLGESSQEIGDIVSLINDIADQTNILALNAAIQASMAGEAGRGFAVVADEVQRLAERSANATKQIEGLVKTIQNDTNEAVVSMEQTTAEVVNGAALAERAGVSLEEIESVSSNLAELIQNISNAARQQAASAGHISTTMNVIQEITVQTSQGTSDAADSIGQLAEMAVELQDSVAGFKLPSDVAEDIPEDAIDELIDLAEDESPAPTTVG
ncbi:MAG: methyl-accepting chemotaxis protein [Pseudomonadales bacterium]|jgi:twitching motility protein PilJ